MTSPPPIKLLYNGETFVPPIEGGWAARARRFYEVGKEYMLEEERAPSTKTRSHFHAALKEAFDNLPEKYADQFPTIEHLRKRALIQTGFSNTTSMVMESKGQAVRIAGLLRQYSSPYTVVIVRDHTILIAEAESEREIAKDKVRYQDMKNKVLGWVSTLVGVTTTKLYDNAGRSA